MLQHNSKLKSLIDRLWNSFWSGGIANPLTAIEQITYLLFMKRLDDVEIDRERSAKLAKKRYKSRFIGKYKIPGTKEEISKTELRWSNFKGMPAEALLNHVQNKVFPFLKELNGETSHFTKHMANAVFIMPKASMLFDSIAIIEEIFTEIEKDAIESGQSIQDIQGDVYEMLLGEIATAGKMGQFRTPRHIINLMIELVEPKVGQNICDPACGTGGFLLGAYQYILANIAKKAKSGSIVSDEDGFERANFDPLIKNKALIDNSLFGFDIDPTMVRLGLMNLMMHGIDEPNIENKDTLSKSYNEDNHYQLVLGNPPFTGNVDSSDRNPSLNIGTNKSELLFLYRFYNMLEPGGTSAVIIPQGVLFGNGKAFKIIRKLIIEHCELKAVISMPGGVFKPYAGVATAILIFTKGNKTRHVWFYDMLNDGYTLDDKRNRIEKNDIPSIISRFKNRNVKNDSDRSSQTFFVSKKEIIDNDYDLSFNRYQENVYEDIQFEDSKVIFDKLRTLELDINEELTELEKLVL